MNYFKKIIKSYILFALQRAGVPMNGENYAELDGAMEDLETGVRQIAREEIAKATDWRETPEVKALIEALEALEKRMWRSGAGTVGFKWCAVCGRSDLDMGKIGHKPDCPFAALMPFEEMNDANRE